VIQEVKVVGSAAKKVKIIGGLMCFLGLFVGIAFQSVWFGLLFFVGLFVFIAGRFVE